jgi:hypothetical protein
MKLIIVFCKEGNLLVAIYYSGGAVTPQIKLDCLILSDIALINALFQEYLRIINKLLKILKINIL